MPQGLHRFMRLSSHKGLQDVPVVAFPHLGEDVPASLLLSTAYCFNKELALRPGEIVRVHSPTRSLMLGS